jgi:hypothetical protein
VPYPLDFPLQVCVHEVDVPRRVGVLRQRVVQHRVDGRIATVVGAMSEYFLSLGQFRELTAHVRFKMRCFNEFKYFQLLSKYKEL